MIEIPESVETWEETEKTIGETLPVIYGQTRRPLDGFANGMR